MRYQRRSQVSGFFTVSTHSLASPTVFSAELDCQRWRVYPQQDAANQNAPPPKQTGHIRFILKRCRCALPGRFSCFIGSESCQRRGESSRLRWKTALLSSTKEISFNKTGCCHNVPILFYSLFFCFLCHRPTFTRSNILYQPIRRISVQTSFRTWRLTLIQLVFAFYRYLERYRLQRAKTSALSDLDPMSLISLFDLRNHEKAPCNRTPQIPEYDHRTPSIKIS